MFVFLSMILLCLSLSSTELTVKYAAIIFRHGDRTPVECYPTDPWRDESNWPVKFGQLTNTGKMQHYALGQWIRQRYAKLLPEGYDPDQVYVRSTDVDRTLMSAQANLAGLFPPSGKSVWNKNLFWQPIPVHTVPVKEDEILAMEKQCKVYEDAKENYLHSAKYKRELSKYQGLMDYLSSYTGMKVQNFNDINYIYNTLYIETLYNKTLPSWTRKIFPEKLLAPAGYSFRLNTMTPLMARLYVGPLLKQILTNIADVVANNTELKLSIYSGHDLTVGSVLNSLDLYDGVNPTYTSTIFMELIYDDERMIHNIKISYRNTTEIVEPNALVIRNCGALCPLDRFKHLYSNMIPIDWERECKLEENLGNYSRLKLYMICAFLALLFLYKALFAWMKNNSRPSTDYSTVQVAFSMQGDNSVKL